jgi:hypothetical protein
MRGERLRVRGGGEIKFGVMNGASSVQTQSSHAHTRTPEQN